MRMRHVNLGENEYPYCGSPIHFLSQAFMSCSFPSSIIIHPIHLHCPFPQIKLKNHTFVFPSDLPLNFVKTDKRKPSNFLNTSPNRLSFSASCHVFAILFQVLKFTNRACNAYIIPGISMFFCYGEEKGKNLIICSLCYRHHNNTQTPAM